MELSTKVLLSNLAIAAFSIGPPFVLLLFYKWFPFGYVKQLIYGFLLIVWSMITFSYFSGVLETLQGVDMGSEGLKESLLGSLNLWVFAYPAIVLALGTNFLTQFFLSWNDDQ